MTNKEEIIYAPIEIESADQLHALGYRWEDCKTWKFGVTPVTVLLVPADRETSAFLIDQLNRKYAHVNRGTRCKVPGTRKPLISCPEWNSCNSCPYGKQPEDRQSHTVSLDQLLEDGFDLESDDSTSSRALASLELDRIFRLLQGENPLYVQIVRLRAAGYTSDEIARMTGISRATLFRYYQRIRELAVRRGGGGEGGE